MWFNPSELKNTELNPTATFATSATYRNNTIINIVPIIKGESSESSESSTGVSIGNLIPEYTGLAKLAKLATPQTVENDDRHYCRTCKNLSGKFCRSKKEKVIDDVVRRCVDYSANGLEPTPIANIANYKRVICGDCLNFKCHNKHGKGAGYCLVGVGFVLWSDTLHECGTFENTREEQ